MRNPAHAEAAQSAPAAVEVIGVSKSFDGPSGTVRALRDVSLTIAPNEFFTLLGPSGCGKTTLLRLIAGFETPGEGEIRLEGEPIGERPPYRRLVNTVFQNYALFPHMTVGENIGFGLRMRGFDRAAARERVAEMVTLVRLEGMEGRSPEQLSGGQQQRVALARALANHPKVLLLDEPLSALDFKLRKEMRLELKRLQRETGITFIFVTHDQEEALEMSDRIAVMSSGTPQQVATPEEIYEHPVSRFVADFIGETNFLEAVVDGEADGLVACVMEGVGTVRAAGEAAPGERVTLAVRPEALMLEAPRDDAPALSGEVVECIYQGSVTAYHVRLADGQVVIGRAGEDDAGPARFAAGERAALRLRAGGARIVQS